MTPFRPRGPTSHLTVIVDNADDTGELTLQWLQPEVGTSR